MKKLTLHYLSADGETNIRAIKWMPEGKPKAVVQIIHGMTEHIERYDDFAHFLTEYGYVVVAEDHLGHGESVVSKERYGYFGEKGNEWIISDIHHLRKETQNIYMDLPYFMLGHSMGSFLLRQYITEDDANYAKDLAGVVIMGTGWQPNIALVLGKFLAKLFGTKKLQKRAKLIEAVSFGSYLKKLEKPRSSRDWLTRDKEIIKLYKSDPRCTFHFTPNAFYHMFSGMQKAHDIERMKKLPIGLPILFCSGAEDPVGAWGEGVRKTFVKYEENTACEVSIKLYLDDRHEILNELNKFEVYDDLLEFFEQYRK